MSTLSITVIQADLHWENKTANLLMLEEKIFDIQEKTEVVVLPEMFSTGFSMRPELLAEDMSGETIQWMKRVAAQKRIILTGSFICRDDVNGLAVNTSNTVQSAGSAPIHYYNRLIWMQPDGRYGIYDKRHLFAFAGESNHYTAGAKRIITSVNGWKINLQVCYDLRFPVWARQQQQSSDVEYDLLIYVANWPERRRLAWKTLLRARAIENQCYVIGVNRVGKDGNNIHYCGDSMVIDPLGEVLYHKKDEEDIVTINLEKQYLQTVRQQFPFLIDADRFVILKDEQKA